MGLFENVEEDFKEVEEYVAGIPAGTHHVMVSNIHTEDKDSGKYVIFTYTVVDDDSKFKGKSHNEYIRLIEGGATTENDTRSLRALKTRLLSFEIPESKMKSIDPDDIVGTEGALTLVDQPKNPSWKYVLRFNTLSATPSVAMPIPKSGAASKANKADKSDNPFE